MNKKPGLTLEEHREVGSQLKEVEQSILQLQRKLEMAFPLTKDKGRPYQAIGRALQHIRSVRVYAESNYIADYPGRFEVDTYYGPIDEE